MASPGIEVMVKPPGFGMPGMCTSSHWPGRNYTTSYHCQKCLPRRKAAASMPGSIGRDTPLSVVSC